MTDPSDEILVKRSLQGDTTCFEVLCKKYYPALIAIAHAISGNEHLAQDAAQETIAEACRRLRSLRNRHRFGSWLSAICRNIARDMLAKQNRLCQAAEDVTPYNPDGDGEEKEALYEALHALPEQLRQVVYLRYYNEMTYEQMSNVLNLSPQAINGRLRRARKKIASTMKANGFGDNEL